MVNKIVGDSTKLLEGRASRVYLRERFPLHSLVVLVLLLATLSFGTACGRTSAAPAIPSPEVEVATVLQKDVPIVSEWVATLDGYVNAQIQSQVAGYIIQQTYKEGSFVRKGQILFQIDPRTFEALLDQANAQLAQTQAQLAKTQKDVDRLSHMRNTGGVTGYLEVLTNETNAFSAELAVVQTRQNELLALVQLYEALGGGWQR